MDLLLQNTQGYMNNLAKNNNIKRFYKEVLIDLFVCAHTNLFMHVSNFVQWSCGQRIDCKNLLSPSES